MKCLDGVRTAVPMCRGVGVRCNAGGKWGVVDSMPNMLCFAAHRMEKVIFAAKIPVSV